MRLHLQNKEADYLRAYDKEEIIGVTRLLLQVLNPTLVVSRPLPNLNFVRKLSFYQKDVKIDEKHICAKLKVNVYYNNFCTTTLKFTPNTDTQ